VKLTAADVAQDFLSVVWDGEPPSIEELSRALDRMLYLHHGIALADCAEDDRHPPVIDGPALYREVAARFLDLGLYPISDPLALVGDGDMVADAIDDIADITRDLREVVWREQHLGAGDAAWCFRLLFSHWGRHARELSLYLHARQFG
jgi:hypothetical protein